MDLPGQLLRFLKGHRHLIVVLGVVAAYWILESALDAFVFSKGSFPAMLLAIEHHEIWMRVLVSGMLITLGIVTYVFNRRITHSRNRVVHLNRVLRAIRDVNQLITRETDSERLLRESCAILTGTQGYTGAWIAHIRGTRELFSLYENGFGDAFGPMRQRLEQEGLTDCMHRTIDSPTPVVVQQPGAMCPDCPLACNGDVERCMVMRIQHDETLYGILSVSMHREFVIDEEEHELLQEIAGDLAFALHTINNENARKHAEEKLRTSEENLRVTLDSIGDGVISTDTKGNVVHINRVASALTGWAPQTARGRALSDVFTIINAKTRIACENPVQKVLETGKIRGLANHTVLVSADGSEYQIADSAAPIKDEEGAIRGVVLVFRDVTDEYAMQQELMVREERFRSLFDTMKSGVAIYRAVDDGGDFTFVEVNAAVERIENVDKQTLLGKRVREVFPAVESFGLLKVMRQVWRSGEPVEHPVTFYHDGRISGWRDNRVYKLSTGEIVAVYEDLTEQKAAEERVRKEHELLVHIADAIPLGIMVISTDKKIRFANRNVTRLWGDEDYGGIEQINYDDIVRNITSPGGGTFPDEELSFHKVMKTGEAVHDIRYAITAPNGRELQLSVNAAPMRDASGAIEGVVAVFSEISDRIEAEKRLRMQARVLDQIHDLVTVTDLDGYITYVNQAECRLFGKGEHEIVGNHISMFGSDARIGATQHEILEAVRNKGHWRGEVVNVTPEGSRVLLDSRVDMVFDEYGTPQALCGVSTDITEQRRLEEQVRYTEKMEAIGQLAGGIAHNFNNQLAGIMGFADLLRESVDHDHNLIRYCDNIITAANRSSDLTAQLLAYARKGKYQNIAVDMHVIIEEVVTLLEQSIDKRVEIDMRLYAQNHIVNGDPGQLQGVCMNIAINARDAMPNGGRITFNTAEVFLDQAFCARSSFELTSGSYLKIMIRDNGTGMRDEIVAHIFEPFFTTKQVGEGTGIGLSAAYGTVKNHNGAIEVESEEGQGSVFTVYLPLVQQKEIDLNEQKRTQQSIQGKGHILLVDDEEMMCDVGEKMLNTLGYEVTTAKNGAEAVEFFSQHHSTVDCVILDMVMPVMGGKEAFVAMRDINPDVPALLSTGYSIKGEAEEILDEGVKGFIQKPFTKAEFSQKIAEVMGKGDDA